VAYLRQIANWRRSCYQKGREFGEGNLLPANRRLSCEDVGFIWATSNHVGVVMRFWTRWQHALVGVRNIIATRFQFTVKTVALVAVPPGVTT
jgi:hypothetical protein